MRLLALLFVFVAASLICTAMWFLDGEPEAGAGTPLAAAAVADGTITAVEIHGIYAQYMCTTGIEHFIDNTRIPHLKCVGVTADISIPPAWWFRCEQLPNSFCFTLVFDHVAAALGLDPTEVALKNDGCEGHDTSYLDKYKKDHGFPFNRSLRSNLIQFASLLTNPRPKLDQWGRRGHRCPGIQV